MIISYIKRKYEILFAYIHWYKTLRYRGFKNAYVIGTPTHANIGDSAIALAEIDFIRSKGYDNIIEITLEEYISFRKCIRRMIPRKSVIFLLGGRFYGEFMASRRNVA